MSHQTTVHLKISAGHDLEFMSNSRRLSEALSIPVNEDFTLTDLNAVSWFQEHESLLIEYFNATVLAVIADTLRETVDLYNLEQVVEYRPNDVITLTIQHWG